MSNTLCVARESVFLYAAHKLTAILYQKRIKAYNEMATLTEHDKTHGHEENSILSSIYVLLFQFTLDDIVHIKPTECYNGTRFRQHEH